jgi:DNA polymerase-3 subunit chi
MPDVNFYILPSNSEHGRLNFACKLAEKAYRSGNKVYMLTENEMQKKKLNELLWTFRAGSFVPHQEFSENSPDETNKVLIGSAEAPENWQQTIINLSSQCPENPELSERILEILDNDESVKNAGRKRYRHYQQSGFKIITYKM